MKERLITRSGKYHGNPLNKEYHSWGKGGGGGPHSTKFYTCWLCSEIQPLTLLYTIFDRKGTFFVLLPLTNGTPFMHLFWIYATGWRQNVCVGQTWQGYCFRFCGDLHLTSLCSGLFQKICLKEGEVWRKFFSNIVIVTFVTQGVPSSFLFRSIAHEVPSSPKQERMERGDPEIEFH